jgi:phosphomannomutase
MEPLGQRGASKGLSGMVAFGTSGVRGLADDLLAGPGWAYASAFAAYLGEIGQPQRAQVFIGCDRRWSSPALTAQCIDAVASAGCTPVYCGVVPTPALALRALGARAGAIMVTGSHIPADRNGLKFYRPDGEIGKADESRITGLVQGISGKPARAAPPLPDEADAATASDYLDRYRRSFPSDLLAGRRVGVYEHSTVAAGILADLAVGFGAEVVRLGYSDIFVALDTEAVDAATAARLAGWAREHGLDLIVSADGDGDRPLVADETGRVVRGDTLGLLAARLLEADAVVTPVSSNPGIGGAFDLISTRIGSPYVLAGMEDAARRGFRHIVGFEANGGLLLGSDVKAPAGDLSALPTRDSVLPFLCAAAWMRRTGHPLSRIVADLGLPACASDRVENVPRAASDRLMAWLRADAANVQSFVDGLGTVAATDDVDGLRARFADGSSIHFRPSGNAPEMRCYACAAGEDRARALLEAGLERIAAFTVGA